MGTNILKSIINSPKFKKKNKNFNSKNSRRTWLEFIDKDSYQLKGKSRNKGKTYMNKYTAMSKQILNTISNRRDIKVPIHTKKLKSQKKSKNSRNGVTSLRTGSSNPNRISSLNKYISMISSGLPYGNRNDNRKKLNSKSSKKSGSRLNSSALSVYSEHQSNSILHKNKENANNVSLNSYCNVPIGLSQYQTLNNSMLNSSDFEGKISDLRNKSGASKGRIKTTSTNSHFNAEKLLNSNKKKKLNSLTRMNTLKKKPINNKKNLMRNNVKSFQTLDMKSAHNR